MYSILLNIVRVDPNKRDARKINKRVNTKNHINISFQEPYYLWSCSKGNHGLWFLVLDRALAWPTPTVNKKSTKNDNSLN